MKKTLKDRFWEKVDVCGSDNCWEWEATKTSKGYGVFSVDGKARYATHVLFYLRHNYWPPKGRTANHHCDNTGCMNPRHLYLGTQKSNARDREERGRGNHAKGEHNGKAKLTEKEVRTIKHILKQGIMLQSEIGEMFDVGCRQISYINTGKNWSHV